MFRILVAVDGSESSDQAVSHLLKKLGWYKERIEVHLLNVQSALPSDVSRFISADQLQAFHREQGEAALAPARAIRDGARVAYVTHIGIGEPAHVIAHYANEKAITVEITKAAPIYSGLTWDAIGDQGLQWDATKVRPKPAYRKI